MQEDFYYDHATLIQCWWRGCMARRYALEYPPDTHAREATSVSRMIAPLQISRARWLLEQERHLDFATHLALILQRLWRAYLARKLFREMLRWVRFS